jgi:hypothetical protein
MHWCIERTKNSGENSSSYLQNAGRFSKTKTKFKAEILVQTAKYCLPQIKFGWFIVNIQSDLFWHRCLERQTFGTPRMYVLSPSKSIKGSNYGKFLKDKKVLLCTRLYKYAPNLESIIFSSIFYFVLFSLISFCFRWFRFHFVSFLLISFRTL